MNSLSSNGSNPHATKPPPPVIIGIRLKKTTSQVIRAATEPIGGGQRKEITIISQSSIKNAKEVLVNADPELNSMIVATYPETYPDDGRIVKAHHKALNQAIERKLGEYSYFTAIEYQSRGAPHFHEGLSISLADYGEVTTLKRKNMTRRLPTFQTVKPLQDWAFEMWKEIISKPDICYDGQPLDWSGLDDEDIEAMDKAYYHYNAGFSWEVMRETDGAKRYFVKELTGLKIYQKTIPDDYKHPGRHFLYGRDMRFDMNNALTFIIGEHELRELLKDWKFLPDQGKPLFKYLWNTAADLAVSLIEAGYRPINYLAVSLIEVGCRPVKTGLGAISKYADLRMMELGGVTHQTFQDAMKWADIEIKARVFVHNEQIRRRIIYDVNKWDNIFANAPPSEQMS